MYIKKLNLKNFRNYKELTLDFNPNVNLILGNNAQGKTNLLESIYITSIGKSFRTNKINEMIKFNEDFSKVSVKSVKEDFEESIDILINHDSKKEIKVNKKNINKASDLLNKIYVVIFSPEDLKIVKDEPEKRRKFIDRELIKIKTSYYDNIINYKNALNERNAYLKEYNIDKNLLDIWDRQLSKYGAKVINQRKIFINEINIISNEIHSNITNGKENLKIEYAPNIKYNEDLKELEEYFYKKLKDNYESDLKNRTTGCGPHKDDIEFYIDDINVRSFGSQGQQRTTALSLKLAELNIIKKETGEDAILLLDDVMSELDYERQKFLVKSLSNNQLFITTTEIPEILLNEFEGASIYRVEKGNITY